MAVLPRKIYLTGMNGYWSVSYIRSYGELMLVEQPHRKLVIYGKRHSKRDALHLLTKWVKLKSKDYLTKELRKLSRQTKIRYKKLTVRSQRTQWGSYSTSRTISLNYKLIFLPPGLIKHLMIHELCHVQCQDHSDKFWKLVAKYDPRWKSNKKALDDADMYVPEWLL